MGQCLRNGAGDKNSKEHFLQQERQSVLMVVSVAVRDSFSFVCFAPAHIVRYGAMDTFFCGDCLAYKVKAKMLTSIFMLSPVLSTEGWSDVIKIHIIYFVLFMWLHPVLLESKESICGGKLHEVELGISRYVE